LHLVQCLPPASAQTQHGFGKGGSSGDPCGVRADVLEAVARARDQSNVWP